MTQCDEVQCECRPAQDGNNACQSSGDSRGFFCQARDAGCVWSEVILALVCASLAGIAFLIFTLLDRHGDCVFLMSKCAQNGPQFASSPDGSANVVEIPITSCANCRCISACVAGQCMVSPWDLNCVDWRGARPAQQNDSNYYINCKYCSCQPGQPRCGGISIAAEGQAITSCIPDTSKSCEMFPPQVDPITSLPEYWFSAGEELQVDSLGNPHEVLCGALCECNIQWVMSGGVFAGTCPVQDTRCAPAPGMPSNGTHMTGVICPFPAYSCQLLPGDVFMRAPMPDPTNFSAGVCYDVNGRLPKKGPWSTPYQPYWGACSPPRVSSFTGPHSGCISAVTDMWAGPGTSTECETNICSLLPSGECDSCICRSDCNAGSCVVRNPACNDTLVPSPAYAIFTGQDAFGQSIWNATCDACVCKDQASCSYDENLKIHTCTPATDCYDPLMGYVYAAFRKMACEPTLCSLDNGDPGNFACFSDLCNTTTTTNEACAPRYCECEGPCIVTLGKVSGVCEVRGDLPCIQPPPATDLL